MNGTCGNDAWTGANLACLAGVGPNKTIQAAINTAVNDDTVFVLGGQTYCETINFLGKAITASGSNPATTFLDGNGADYVVVCTNGKGSTTVLTNLIITDGQADGGLGDSIDRGMVCDNTSPRILNCIFQNNVASLVGGRLRIDGGHPQIIDCSFIDNSVGASGGGIASINSSPTIQNCTFQGNLGGLFISLGSPGIIDS